MNRSLRMFQRNVLRILMQSVKGAGPGVQPIGQKPTTFLPLRKFQQYLVPLVERNWNKILLEFYSENLWFFR